MLSKKAREAIIWAGAAIVVAAGAFSYNYFSSRNPYFEKPSAEQAASVRPANKLGNETIDALAEFLSSDAAGGREAVISEMVQVVPYPQDEHVYTGLLLTEDGLILTTEYATADSKGKEYDNIFVTIDGKAALAEIVASDPANNISLIYCPTGKKADASGISLYKGDFPVGQKAEAIFGYGDRMYWRTAEIVPTNLSGSFFRLKQENPSEKVSGGFITIDGKLAGIIISEYTEKIGIIVKERSILAAGMDTVKGLADLLIEYSRQ